MVHPRPHSLVVVVGTGTEVGKTWVSAAVLTELASAGVATGARKPAQSHEPGDDPMTFDAAILGGATGEAVALVCPAHLTFPVALAPPMAALELDQTPPTMDELLRFAPFEEGCDVGLIETAGGLRSPQAIDGDALDLCVRLAPDHVVLVADAGLGTISTVRLCTAALDSAVAAPVTVVLNRFDERHGTHVKNRAWLEDVDGLRVLVSPGEVSLLAATLRSTNSQA